MSDQDLTELLERASDALPVGPAPLAAVHARARRRRGRKAALAGLAVAAAVAAVIAGTLAVVPHDPDRPDLLPTPKTRLFGLGHVAVEVPATWARGRRSCAAPRVDTVMLDDGGTTRSNCIRQDPTDNIETITLQRYRPEAQPPGTDELVIDDVEVFGTTINCNGVQPNQAHFCVARVFVPSEKVVVQLSSQTSRAKVVEMRGWIRVLPGRSAIPLPGATMNGRSGANYQRLLQEHGFRAVKKVDFDGTRPTGEITQISPAPGTVLKPGSTVRFTVSSQLHSPSHNVRLSFSVANPGSRPFTLKDSTIRIAGYVRTTPGARVTLFIRGADENRRQLHVRVNDRYLRTRDVIGAVPRGVSAYVWTPVATGRTTLTIYTNERGQQVTVGIVVLRIYEDL